MNINRRDDEISNSVVAQGGNERPASSTASQLINLLSAINPETNGIETSSRPEIATRRLPSTGDHLSRTEELSPSPISRRQVQSINRTTPRGQTSSSPDNSSIVGLYMQRVAAENARRTRRNERGIYNTTRIGSRNGQNSGQNVISNIINSTATDFNHETTPSSLPISQPEAESELNNSSTPLPTPQNNLLSNIYSSMSKPIHYTPGGYPDELFEEFSPDDRERLQCNICFLISKEARRCSQGHLFCASCIFTWTFSTNEGRGKCPVCRTEGRYRPDFQIEDELDALRVKCNIKSCNWAGVLKLYRHHRKSHKDIPKDKDKLTMVLPPINTLFPNNSPLYVGSSSSGNLHELGLSELNSDINARRSRLTLLMELFEEQLERRRENIESFYREREVRRRENLREVEELSHRLGNVSRDLDSLLNNMSRDSQTFRQRLSEIPDDVTIEAIPSHGPNPFSLRDNPQLLSPSLLSPPTELSRDSQQRLRQLRQEVEDDRNALQALDALDNTRFSNLPSQTRRARRIRSRINTHTPSRH